MINNNLSSKSQASVESCRSSLDLCLIITNELWRADADPLPNTPHNLVGLSQQKTYLILFEPLLDHAFVFV